MSRNLDTEGTDEWLTDVVVRMGARRVHNDTLLVVDVSEIAKPSAKKMEHLGKSRDESTGEVTEMVIGHATCSVRGGQEAGNSALPGAIFGAGA